MIFISIGAILKLAKCPLNVLGYKIIAEVCTDFAERRKLWGI